MKRANWKLLEHWNIDMGTKMQLQDGFDSQRNGPRVMVGPEEVDWCPQVDDVS
jgi:hypothetical protein